MLAGLLGHAYGYADLGRTGLGNKLFPWARCLLWCQRHGARLLPSEFFQVPLGPLLRGERDLRLYHRLFRRTGVIDRVERRLALAALPNERETGDQQFALPIRPGRVYRFAGLGACFETLNGHEELVRERLIAKLRPEWQRAALASPAPLVGVHVRLGDFSVEQRHPIEWYVRALELVRRLAGWTVPAQVFTDGGLSELAPLLRLPATALVEGNNAVTDLILLSRSRFLIATGSSTFGAWAAYLGQMPALTRRGNPFSWWKLRNGRGRFIGEIDEGEPPAPLVADVGAALSRSEAASCA